MNSTTYFIITLLFGWCGAHKFIQKKYGMGLLYLFTFGLFTFGWAIDCIRALLPILRHKNGEPSPHVVYDDSSVININTLIDDRQRIVDDCTRLISSTTNSDVFFSRYDLLLKTLSDMGDYVMLGRYNDYKQSNIESFIVRSYNNALIKADGMKTEKGKCNQFRKAYDDIMKHSSELSDHTLELVEQKFSRKK